MVSSVHHSVLLALVLVELLLRLLELLEQCLALLLQVFELADGLLLLLLLVLVLLPCLGEVFAELLHLPLGVEELVPHLVHGSLLSLVAALDLLLFGVFI